MPKRKFSGEEIVPNYKYAKARPDKTKNYNGLPVFNTMYMADKEYDIMAVFMYRFENGDTEPCFLIRDPDTGEVMQKACVRMFVTGMYRTDDEYKAKG